MPLKMSDFRNADFWSAYFAFRPEKPKKKSDQFRLFYGIFNPETGVCRRRKRNFGPKKGNRLKTAALLIGKNGVFAAC